MKNTLETRLGVFVALTIVAGMVIVEMIGAAGFIKPGMHIRARFNTVQDLKQGDMVKVAGVNIGRVEKVDFADNKVEVTMKLTKKDQVRTDSKAVIRFLGMMGQNYVSISFGSANAPLAADGFLIETTEQPDMNALIGKLESVATGIENVTKSFSGESFGNLLGPFTDFLKENNPKITAILGNMQNISSQLAEGKGTAGKVIMDDQLYSTALGAVSNLNHTATEVQDVIGQAKTVVKQITEGQGTLGKLTKDEKLYTETTTAMTNLREVLQKINTGQGSVGKLVNDESLFKKARMTLQKLD